MKELARAIDELFTEYEKALKNPHIVRPIAYALYKVWRIEDRRKNKKKGGKTDGTESR